MSTSASTHEENPSSSQTSFQPCRAHIVGSVALKSNTDVFTRLSTAFPKQLSRMPDGETGVRWYFVRGQQHSFKPFLVNWYGEFPQEDAPEGPLIIEPINTRYDEFAIESYKEFYRLREEGVIPKGVRFQVSLPTPVNILGVVILHKYISAVEPFLEAELMAVARRIQDAIPHEDLAIQWDMAIDIAIIEFSEPDMAELRKLLYMPEAWFSPVHEGIVERAVKVMKSIDSDVPMGVHLCYGDNGRKHFIEPENTKLMVTLANDIFAGTGRDLDWVHMPVPKDRDDDAYFAPLKDLKGANTELVLGLCHAEDLEGTKKRIETAGKFAGSFAVGTECGMGRMDKEELDSVLEIMAAVTTKNDDVDDAVSNASAIPEEESVTAEKGSVGKVLSVKTAIMEVIEVPAKADIDNALPVVAVVTKEDEVNSAIEITTPINKDDEDNNPVPVVAVVAKEKDELGGIAKDMAAVKVTVEVKEIDTSKDIPDVTVTIKETEADDVQEDIPAGAFL